MARQRPAFAAANVLALAAALSLLLAGTARAQRMSGGGGGRTSWGGGGSSWGGGGSSWGGAKTSAPSSFGFGSKPMAAPARPATGVPMGGTVTGYPAKAPTGAAPSSFKPAPGAPLPTMPVAPAGAAAAKPGMFGGAAGLGAAGGAAGAAAGRSRMTSLAMPFVMGAFAGTAAHALLSSNPSARCNGVRPECYRSHCQSAMQACPAAAGQSLVLGRCPSGSPFTECWEARDRSFQCFGYGRPTANQNFEPFCGTARAANASASAAPMAAGAVGAALGAGAAAAVPQGKAGPNGVVLTGAAGGRGAGAVAVAALAAGAALLLA